MKALDASTLIHSLKRAAGYTMSRTRSNRKGDFLCDVLEIKHLCVTEGYDLLPACLSDIKQTRPLLWSALTKEETMPPEAKNRALTRSEERRVGKGGDDV